ncbi:hypothetical protein [Sporomusa aerivorans]|uniref:hypothetical protein n=1 Tax=Sporomusa aerivorans TaxID=204936 RepID=UPI003529E663
MADILYWVIMSAIGVATGWFVAGHNGLIFLSLVCLFGGIFLLIENKIHPPQPKQ